MGRPVFPYELADPDFCWLIANFQDQNQSYIGIEVASLPVVFIPGEPEERIDEEAPSVASYPHGETSDEASVEEPAKPE